MTSENNKENFAQSGNKQPKRRVMKKQPSQAKQTSQNRAPASAKQKAGNKAPAKQMKPQKQLPVYGIVKQAAPVKRRKNNNVQKNGKQISISFLGGLNEIGKNITVYEYEGDILIVDCGLAFPDSTMLGVDAVIPDFTYLAENASRIKGIVITHGHEDHIGGIPYLLKEINAPVYGTRLTVGLIEYKLKEHGILNTCKLNVFNAGDTLRIGKFSVECIHVNHSIPDAVALAIRTGAGTIVQTGDFKIDNTPIDGEVINLPRFAQIGKEGVLALLQDSTNAEKEGYTLSESKVGETFEALFRKAGNKRIIVATFASNVHRIQQIMDVAKGMGRKVAITGRSMENIVKLGEELGYLKVKKGLLINQDEIRKCPDNKLVLICTGSQGEPMAALSKMALSEHRQVEIGANDYVIISARPIPGNEKGVGNVINGLMMRGADVIYENMYNTHVSGHACQEELKMMLNFIHPKLFIPVHGEQKHLRKHAMLAENMGMSSKNIIIADNGDKLTVSSSGKISKREKVTSGITLIDGSGVGDVGSVVLRDRSRLASAGIVAVTAAVDMQLRMIITGPEIISRGFVYVKDNEELINKAMNRSTADIEKFFKSNNNDLNVLRNQLRDDISQLMYRQTKRSPMILPIIMEV